MKVAVSLVGRACLGSSRESLFALGELRERELAGDLFFLANLGELCFVQGFVAARLVGARLVAARLVGSRLARDRVCCEAVVGQRVRNGDERRAGNEKQSGTSNRDPGPHTASAKKSASSFVTRHLGDPVPAADYGVDQRRLAELSAQPQDGYGDSVGERIGVLIPDLFEQLLGAHHSAVRRY
jgi:hypothetical protein